MALTKIKGSVDQVYQTVAEMKANTANVGDYVKTLGYYSVNDGGGAEYYIMASSDFIGTPDGYGDHVLNSGQVAVLQINGPVKPRQFGARGNGSVNDATSLLQASYRGAIDIEDGEFRVANNIILQGPIEFSAGGKILADPNVVVGIGGNTVETFINVRTFGATGNPSVADDGPAIQAAIDSLSNAIYFPVGTYNIQTPVKINSNTLLYFHPHARIVRNAAINNLFRNNADGITGGYSANTNIRIIGGSFDGNSSGFPGTACSLFAFGHCEKVTISDAVFKNVVTDHAIHLSSVLKVNIDNCKFETSTLAADAESINFTVPSSSTVFPYFGPYDNYPSEDVSISRCNFTQVGAGIGAHASVAGVLHRNIRIKDCSFDNLSHNAVNLLNFSAATVKNNFVDTADFGVKVQASFGSTPKQIKIVNNTFINIDVNNTSRAIHVTGENPTDRRVSEVVISGNNVSDISDVGVSVDYCKEVTVTGNIIRRCDRQGLGIYGSTDFSVTGNVVKDNNLDVAAGVYDLLVGGTGSTDTLRGTVIANTVGTGNVTQCNNVIVRTNNFITSLASSANVSSSVGENLVAGALV